MISVKGDVSKILRSLDNFAQKQMPYATALAINATAVRVQKAETEALSQVFDKPTPFTLRAFAVKKATKSWPVAVIYARDKQAQYLAPDEVGGPQFLGQSAKIKTPVGIKLNKAGNLSRNQIQQLLARPDVFLGHVHGVGGIWQRLPPPKTGKRARGAKPVRGAGQVKLLVALTRPVELKPVLQFKVRAAAIASRYIAIELSAAIQKAMATARA